MYNKTSHLTKIKHKTEILNPQYPHLGTFSPPASVSHTRSQPDPDILNQCSPSICGQAGAEEQWKCQGDPGHRVLNKLQSPQNGSCSNHPADTHPSGQTRREHKRSRGHGMVLNSSSEELNAPGHTRYHQCVFSNHPAKHLRLWVTSDCSELSQQKSLLQ